MGSSPVFFTSHDDCYCTRLGLQLLPVYVPGAAGTAKGLGCGSASGLSRHPNGGCHRPREQPAVPPQEKIGAVLSSIQANPGCNTTDIVAQTEISLSTVERCLSELRKRKLIKYVGSKRHGGYYES